VGFLTAPIADACVYNLNVGSPNSAIGTSTTISGTADPGTTCGSSITLNANGPNSPQLFNKQAGAGEMGLGLTNDPNNNDNEVTVGSFIEIDVSNVQSNTMGLSVAGNSVQSGESWEIVGSNTKGTLGNSVVVGPNSTMNEVTFNNPSGFQFLDFTVPAGSPSTINVLLAAFDSFDRPISTPEPASLAILGAALAGFGLMRRRRNP
jgi:hypothetical protein